MMVIGVGPHKQTHTAAAVDRQTAELLDDLTVRAVTRATRSCWAGPAPSPSTELGDRGCRHVSRGIERFLLRSGERVVRVAPKRAALAARLWQVRSDRCHRRRACRAGRA